MELAELVKDVDIMQNPEFHLPDVEPYYSSEASCSCTSDECRALYIHARHLFEQAEHQRDALSRRIMGARELREAVYLTSHELVSAFEKLVEKEESFLHNMELLSRTAVLYGQKEVGMMDEEQHLISELILQIKKLDALESEHDRLVQEKVRLDIETAHLHDECLIDHSRLQYEIDSLQSYLPELRSEVLTLEEVYLRNCVELEATESKLPGIEAQIKEREELLASQKQIAEYLRVRQSVERQQWIRDFEELIEEEHQLRNESQQSAIDVLQEKLLSLTKTVQFPELME